MAEKKSTTTTGATKKRPRMLPAQVELFVADITDWPVKDDLASMEFPIFSLASGDTSIREYVNRSNGRKIRVIPSSTGSATVFDKDILIFAASQIVEAHRMGRPISRTVALDSFNFLQSTMRSTGGKAYIHILDTLRRLKGTFLETDIPTGGRTKTKSFGLIEDYEITRTTAKGVVSEVNVTLAEWFFDAILSFEMLTLDKNYFLLDKSLERRFYELARKHCGDKAYWKIGIDILQEKSGSSQDKYSFKREVKRIIERDLLPEFHVALDANKKPNQVLFYVRDSAKLSLELIKEPMLAAWFSGLLKHAGKKQ